jgi:anti-sigma28 factor (negative regulator of flagellin synthesis)
MTIQRDGYGLGVGQDPTRAAIAAEKSGSGAGNAGKDDDAIAQSGEALPAAHSVPGVRIDKVAGVRAALSAGTYRVSAWTVAEKIEDRGLVAVVGTHWGGDQHSAANLTKPGSWWHEAEATENSPSKEGCCELPVERGRIEADCEWMGLPGIPWFPGCAQDRLDGADCRRLGKLIHLWSICAPIQGTDGEALPLSRRSRRSIAGLQ